MADQYVVLANWDVDAQLWYVKATDIPGLNVEAETLEAFRDIVADLAPDLVRANLGAAPSAGMQPIIVKAETQAGEAAVAKV
ncbi:MAG: DUF1902 domain-containing protein [Pseudomonadota bacterium]